MEITTIDLFNFYFFPEIYLMMALSSTGITVIVSILVLKIYHKEDLAPPPHLLLWICRIQPADDYEMKEADSECKCSNPATPQALTVNLPETSVSFLISMESQVWYNITSSKLTMQGNIKYYRKSCLDELIDFLTYFYLNGW